MSQVAQARNMSIGKKNTVQKCATHKKAINRPMDRHRSDVTHILCKASCFFYWNPFIFAGDGNDRFFPNTNPYIPNVTQQCRCSPMLIFRAWASCGNIIFFAGVIRSTGSCWLASVNPSPPQKNKGTRWRTNQWRRRIWVKKLLFSWTKM